MTIRREWLLQEDVCQEVAGSNLPGVLGLFSLLFLSPSLRSVSFSRSPEDHLCFSNKRCLSIQLGATQALCSMNLHKSLDFCVIGCCTQRPPKRLQLSHSNSHVDPLTFITLLILKPLTLKDYYCIRAHKFSNQPNQHSKAFKNWSQFRRLSQKNKIVTMMKSKDESKTRRVSRP